MADITYDFSDARVLITGGSNGIGFGIASAFAHAGATVTITGTRPTASDYEHDLSSFEYHQCLLQEASAVEILASKFTQLDILVNNAGQNLPGGKSEWDAGVFETTVAINLVAPFRLAQAVKPLLAQSQASGGGNVINFGSMTSFFGMEIVPGYGAAKGAVVQMTKTLAVSWAKDNVRVNAIAPGVIESNMTAPMLGYAPLMDPLLHRTPQRRVGTPSDIAPAVLFLASSGARFITGHTLIVDGGFSAQG